MIDEKQLRKAQNMYEAMCQAITSVKLQYEKNEENLLISLTINGNDIPMDYVMQIDVKRELIYIISTIPAKFGENKRLDGALACCLANYNLKFGNFIYNYQDGTMFFKMSSSYTDSLISNELFVDMLVYATQAVDEYNDKFLMLAKGTLDIKTFFD